MPELLYSTVVQQREWAVKGVVTARELVEHSLARIAALNSTLNAFAYVLADEALAAADALDGARVAGEPCGLLHGVPIAIKDENDVAGLPTAYGGAAFTTPATADSEVVRRLRVAGAIIIGKTRRVQTQMGLDNLPERLQCLVARKLKPLVLNIHLAESL